MSTDRLPERGHRPATKNCTVCNTPYNANRRGRPGRTCSPACAKLDPIRARRNIRYNYGIDVTEWEEMFNAQGRKCIFGCAEPGSVYGWSTDHDHITGRVRGILCQPHNIFLGKLEKYRDDLDHLLAYIDNHREEAVNE